MSMCSISGCNKKVRARGWCTTHYDRWVRSGSTALRQEQYSTPEELFEARTMPVTGTGCLLWLGAVTQWGYGKLRVSGRTILAHRYAWERVNGPIPDGMVIDHLCHTPACCNVDHLRLATNAQNRQNLRGARSGSRSGIRGVSWHEPTGKWGVQVTVDGKTHSGGYFYDKHEAGRVAAELRARLMPYTQN